ncbi:GNAT family N-acetyltransferase [Knoellia koreensis]|uniref:GNAT family N-acetyltransferase n=1 Tax=Knoellia koreensis TaxID=2730921 RepID=A0A849HGU0_9MICO|nr:GNAT family N-acetyltransferase [Knoellia sp. DB2414S]NNM46638.1 GNAT family N-acetyltransferase [Knoellia sp. DB2414S]
MVDIVEVSGLDPARDELFRAWAGVFEASDRAEFGDDHSSWTVEQLRELERATDKRRYAWAAVDGDTVVGAVGLVLPLRDNRSMAAINLAVHPDHRGRGVGAALLARAEDQSAAEGRSIFMAESQWREDGEDSAAAFATSHGYAAAQTVLRSSLALPADSAALGELAAGGEPAAYTLRNVVGPLPDELLAARAELSRRMSTDIPLGDLVLEEEVWDEARVREQYDRIEAMGRTAIDTYAVHAATGDVVGYTQVQVSRNEPRIAYQQDTLVMREHRGHALGLRMKAANTLAVMEVSPDSQVIRTWNADDNTHMLAVNRRVGYVTDAYLREWQKDLR